MSDTIIDSYNGKTALTALAFGAVGDSPTAVVPASGLPVRVDGVGDAAIAANWDGSARDTLGYGSAVISVNGLGGGDTIAVKGSVTGTNPKVLAVQDLGSATGAIAVSIAADGLYLVPAAGQLSFVKTGIGSTPTVNLLLKR